MAHDRGASRFRKLRTRRPQKAAAPAYPAGSRPGADGAARYEQTIDPASDSTHARVVRLVGRDKRVLELGCSTGFMSRVLRDRGCRVVGIEQDADAAARARRFCARVIVGDLERIDLGRTLGGARFDVIVAADVLEHLKDPVRILRALRRFLADGGWLVASLPNVAHGSVRLALLGGSFDYNPTGLLDHTHLRFFTRDGVQKLFDEAGFLIGHLERYEMRIEDSEVSFDRAAAPPGLVDALSREPEALTYQFIVVAHALPRESIDLIQEAVYSARAAREGAEARLRRLVEEQQSVENAARELAEAKRAAEAEARRSAAESEGRQRRLEVLEARQAEADALLEEVTGERDEARRERDAAVQTAEAARADGERLRLDVSEREAEAQRLREEARAEVRSLADRLRAREDRIGALEERMAALEGELASRQGLEADLAERDRSAVARERTLAAQQAALSALEGQVAAARADHGEALARMAGMRRTRVWRVGTVYWWIEARLKALRRL